MITVTCLTENISSFLAKYYWILLTYIIDISQSMKILLVNFTLGFDSLVMVTVQSEIILTMIFLSYLPVLDLASLCKLLRNAAYELKFCYLSINNTSNDIPCWRFLSYTYTLSIQLLSSIIKLLALAVLRTDIVPIIFNQTTCFFPQ